ncbi:phage tail protein [Leptobacterium flavescens]|uniref:Phage tail protein n=1 Tax=Leptobacterium flavescens TaxID=472055 RepID=A0A6P0UFP1_9FLAO|nr:phage tail protein [Leptobacterium flavescens]NER12055.1 phage tail protein [Leptobacterium flavescens]
MTVESNSTYQIVGFHFKVSFLNLPTVKEVDVRFQSVGGMNVEVEKETVKEGGENRFEHSIPGRRKYTSLTLKRGILTPEHSGLTQWCQDAFQNMVITPVGKVNIELLNENHDVLMQWELSHVWPVSWKVGELNAEQGSVLIETLELNYNYFKLVTVNP